MPLNLITRSLELLSWTCLAKRHSVGHIGRIKTNSAVGHSSNLCRKVTSKLRRMGGHDRVFHKTVYGSQTN
jgi:hypothetical protein